MARVRASRAVQRASFGRRPAKRAMAAADAALVQRGLVAEGTLTAAGRRLRDAVEEQTDAAMAPLLDAIGPELPQLTRQLDEWSAAIEAGGAAPTDPYKRLTG